MGRLKELFYCSCSAHFLPMRELEVAAETQAGLLEVARDGLKKLTKLSLHAKCSGGMEPLQLGELGRLPLLWLCPFSPVPVSFHSTDWAICSPHQYLDPATVHTFNIFDSALHERLISS